MLQSPLFLPTSTWTPPTYFPKVGDVFGYDMETKDPNLKERGPSSIRGGGYPVGMSFAEKLEDGSFLSNYFPFAHEGGGNMDKRAVLRWAKPILEDPTKLLIGAKLDYELEWCSFLGVEIKCKLWDIQAAEALLCENSFKFSLDTLCWKYLGTRKNEALLIEWAQAWGLNAKEDMWRAPARFVGPYAESDACDPIRIYEKQKPLLDKEGLLPVMEMESKLLPIIWKMRKMGVRVNLDIAESVHKEWSIKEKNLYKSLNSLCPKGFSIDSVWEPATIGKACDLLGYKYPRTPKTQEPSFVDAWLTAQSANPFFKTISEIRSVNKLNDTFIQKAILRNSINGRIHCQIHPLKGDENGTVSGRLSYSNPNLQQVPNPEHSDDAWKVRSVFVPEEGEQWGKLDYSQQEPRLVVHYGCVKGFRGADIAANEYQSNPKADFYQILVNLAKITRKESKVIYLGRSYGMGKDKLARSLGVSVEEALVIAEKMDEAVPFIKLLFDDCVKSASNRGFIRTIGGRRAHFDNWEPARWKQGCFYQAKSRELAEKEWPDEVLKRAETHKALNRLIQGSAADMGKRAMILFDEVGILPLIQVHDEFGISFSNPKVIRQAKEIMEHAIKLRVPIYADLKVGRSWGEAE